MIDLRDERIVDDDEIEYRDRRLWARRDLAIQVRITPANDPGGAADPRTYLSRDASSGGLAIRCARPLDAGSNVKLRFALPRASGMVELDGVVAWSVKHERHGGMGVRFARVAPADAMALRRFLGEDERPARAARVLVLDDDDGLRSVVGEALRREGFETFESDWDGAHEALGSMHALVVVGSQRGGDAARFKSVRTRLAPVVALVDDHTAGSEWAGVGASCCLARTADPRSIVQAVRILAPR